MKDTLGAANSLRYRGYVYDERSSIISSPDITIPNLVDSSMRMDMPPPVRAYSAIICLLIVIIMQLTSEIVGVIFRHIVSMLQLLAKFLIPTICVLFSSILASIQETHGKQPHQQRKKSCFSTWEGWALLIGFVAVIIVSMYRMNLLLFNEKH